VRCHHFVTESTFGQPVFRWPAADDVLAALHDWWRVNQSAGRASLLYAYSFGKAQRLLAGLNRETGPVVITREIAAINAHYQAAGIDLGETRVADEIDLAAVWSSALFLAPPSARWRQPFPFHGHFATACASGWMLLPGQVHRRRVDTGFVLSDHADHADILAAIDASGADTVWVTHGYIDSLTAELIARGLDARPLRSPRCSNPPPVPADRQLELAL
jgi:putative mRNA 3-end processing factor